MEKVSAQQVLRVLREVPPTLRKLAAERDQLAQENHQLRTKLNQTLLNDRVEKLAHELHAKHLHQGRSMAQTREILLQKAASGDLRVVEEAMKIAASPSVLGSVGEVPSGGNRLEEFVLS